MNDEEYDELTVTVKVSKRLIAEVQDKKALAWLVGCEMRDQAYEKALERYDA